MSIQYTIRPLHARDHVAFRALRLEALQQHPYAYGTGASAWKQASDAQTMASLSCAEESPKRVTLGAFDESGTLVGMVGLRRETKERVRHKGSVWGLYVQGDHRRRGVGRALMKELLARAAALPGLRYLRGISTAGSDAVSAVLHSSGFAHYGVEPGGLCAGEQFLDQIFWRRDV